jgi:2-keto-3-deoxy-galactonokinase
VEKMLNGFKIVGDATKFWRGDLLVYAQRNFGEMYSQLVDESDMAYQSLKDEMWIANAISPTVRRAELSWSHHREVASLEKESQIKFLALAVDNKLSAIALHKLIKGETVEKDKPPSRSAAFESALKAILKNAMDSEYFNDKFFFERLEDEDKIDPVQLVVTRSAIIASDILKAYRKD